VKNDFIKNWDTQLKKGLLPFYVLMALNLKEFYGYELIQELKTGFGLETTESTVYPLLIRLMKEDLLVHEWVEQPSGIPRKYYYITKEGRKTLKDMKKSMADLLGKIKGL
jgi:PadR family transcriptional regulator PadR